MCTGNSISLIYKNISVSLQNDINVKQKQRIKCIIIIIIAKISKKLRIKWNFELTVFELTVPDL